MYAASMRPHATLFLAAELSALKPLVDKYKISSDDIQVTSISSLLMLTHSISRLEQFPLRVQKLMSWKHTQY